MRGRSSCTLSLTTKELAEPKEHVFAMAASKELTTLQLYKALMRGNPQGLKSVEFRPCSQIYGDPFHSILIETEV